MKNSLVCTTLLVVLATLGSHGQESATTTPMKIDTSTVKTTLLSTHIELIKKQPDELIKSLETSALDQEHLNTLLHYAAYYGRPTCITALLDKGAEMKDIIIHDFTAHKIALIEGNKACIDLFTQKGSVVHNKDPKGWQPIHWASFFGDLDRFNKLLENHANHNALTNHQQNALHFAAWKGHIKPMKELHQRNKYLITAVELCGKNVLHCAAEGGSAECIQFCLDQGLAIESPSNNGWTPLHFAAGWGSLDALNKLLENHANYNALTNDKQNALHCAAWNGRLKHMKELHQRNKHLITAVDINGKTVLYYAAEGGSAECIQFCLDQGLDIESTNNDGLTPLHCAAEWGSLDALNKLLENRANHNALTNDKQNALHFAAFKGSIKSMKELHQRNKHLITAVDRNSQTVLHLAAQGGSAECIQFCLDNGLAIESLCNNGLTPLHYAALADNSESIKFLLSRWASIESQSNDGETPLHVSAKYEKLEALQSLIKCGASLNNRASNNETPLMAAIKADQPECMRILINAGAKITPTNPNKPSVFETALKHGSDDCLVTLMEHSYTFFPLDHIKVCASLKRVLTAIHVLRSLKSEILADTLGMYSLLPIFMSLPETSEDVALIGLTKLQNRTCETVYVQMDYFETARTLLDECLTTQEVKDAVVELILKYYNDSCQKLDSQRKKQVLSPELIIKIRKAIKKGVARQYLTLKQPEKRKQSDEHQQSSSEKKRKLIEQKL